MGLVKARQGWRGYFDFAAAALFACSLASIMEAGRVCFWKKAQTAAFTEL